MLPFFFTVSILGVNFCWGQESCSGEKGRENSKNVAENFFLEE